MNLFQYILGTSTKEDDYILINSSMICDDANSSREEYAEIVRCTTFDKQLVPSYVKADTAPKPDADADFSVGVAESVSAGAVSTALCSEPGASDFFRGSIVAYNTQSKKDLLGIDVEYAERNNHANCFTTEEMARAAAKKLNARIGIATTGYSLPTSRAEDTVRGYCALDIKQPYAIIALYDTALQYSLMRNVAYVYDERLSSKVNRATMQARVAIEAKKMYVDYVKKLKDAAKKSSV
jgi:PncC family amidohydrolase